MRRLMVDLGQERQLRGGKQPHFKVSFSASLWTGTKDSNLRLSLLI